MNAAQQTLTKFILLMIYNITCIVISLSPLIYISYQLAQLPAVNAKREALIAHYRKEHQEYKTANGLTITYE